jgi:hypothetical protein
MLFKNISSELQLIFLLHSKVLTTCYQERTVSDNTSCTRFVIACERLFHERLLIILTLGVQAVVRFLVFFVDVVPLGLKIPMFLLDPKELNGSLSLMNNFLLPRSRTFLDRYLRLCDHA